MESRIHREVYVRFGGEEFGNLFSKEEKALDSLAYYISELLGKGTIDKKSSGETRGRQGSSSRNYDVLGRDLMTPDEARKFDNKKCLIFIRGFDPIVDNKFIPFKHPVFDQIADGKGKPYIHTPKGDSVIIGPPFEILNRQSLAYFEKLKDKGENVYIDSMTLEEFMLLGNDAMAERFLEIDKKEKKQKADRELSYELEYQEETDDTGGEKATRERKPLKNDTVTNRMLNWNFSKEQREEAKMAMKEGVPVNEILKYFYPEIPAEEMKAERRKFRS